MTSQLPDTDGFQRRQLIIFAGVAFTWPLLFALVTNCYWEDFFITFRHSQNLCEGKGLVFNEGERVHGFTSPLGVLLPALCHVLTGQQSYAHAIWLFRLFTCLAFAGGGVLLLQSVKAGTTRPYPVQLLFAALFLLETKAVAFTVNGMETGFMILFVGWAVYLLVHPGPRRWLWQGLCWAGLMWTRPDGCIYVAALGLVQLAADAPAWRATLRTLLASAAVCTVLYLPWFAWAWTYYGSPVPNTVLAKSLPTSTVRDFYWHRVISQAAMVFKPLYYPPDSGWFRLFGSLSSGFGLFCLIYVFIPVRDGLGRMASAAFALLALYLGALASIGEWYRPPVAMFGLIVLARAPFLLAEQFSQVTRIARWVMVLVLLEKTALFGALIWNVSVHQREVEFAHRIPLAQWLGQQVSKGESVYSEPLGYFGYFSNARMTDFPGLVCPAVVRLRREQGLNMVTLVPELQPDWMVLRPSEAQAMSQTEYFQRHYTIVKTFDARQTILDNYPNLPGRNYLLFDACYSIFKKNPPLAAGS